MLRLSQQRVRCRADLIFYLIFVNIFFDIFCVFMEDTALSCLSSVISPIDGKSMESITSVKIFHGSEFKANGKVIRWTEVTHT